MEDYLPHRTIQREVDFMWRKYMQELENLRQAHKEAHLGQRPCVFASIIRRTKELINSKVETENEG